MKFKLFLWLGSRLFQNIVVSSKDDAVDGILFANNADLVNKYSDIKYKKEDYGKTTFKYNH